MSQRSTFISLNLLRSSAVVLKHKDCARIMINVSKASKKISFSSNGLVTGVHIASVSTR